MKKIDKNSVGIVETKTIQVVDQTNPLQLSCGESLAPIHVAYETYGKLNEAKNNVILICHALSGNAHVAGYNSEKDKKPGWWDTQVGPGKSIDTDKYFVICSNFLGGCSGTTGPASINPATQKPYGLSFPIITISDMVKVQKLHLDKLGVNELLAVIGGSMGGMQVFQWTVEYPDFVKSAIAIATTTRLNAQSIAFDAVGRNAILGDPNFADGQYHDKSGPDRGLGIARMIGHITYLSEQGMREKFGRELRSAENYSYEFDSEFAVETYLEYQGQTFVERFDANSYLYITKAMDYFDMQKDFGSLDNAFSDTTCRFLIVSFESDWLFTPAQSEAVVNALLANGKDISYCCMDSPYGHDAFLLEPGRLGLLMDSFIGATSYRINNPGKYILNDIECKHTSEPGYQKTSDRLDYEWMESLVESGSKVLDVGCGDGLLLAKLIDEKNVIGEGVDVDQELITHCIRRGLSAVHHDIERGLKQYASDSFDYAILSQTLQTVQKPKEVLLELIRVAKKVIVSFPNFAHWQCRLGLLFDGKAPITSQLPYSWYDSPNIHCLSFKDFDLFCSELDIKIEKKIPLGKCRFAPVHIMPNLFAQQAIYVMSKTKSEIKD